jgi:dTDP-4-amino-4,6-dideoxygalactose transaminase
LTPQIPLSAPWIDGREEELVVETLRSGQLSLGPMIDRLGYREGMLPVSEDASARTLALPFHARLPAEEQELVVDALARALA